MEIGDPARVWLEADVSEDDAARITCGQHAMVEPLRGGRSADARSKCSRPRWTRRPASTRVPHTGRCGPSVVDAGLLVEVRLSEPQINWSFRWKPCSSRKANGASSMSRPPMAGASP